MDKRTPWILALLAVGLLGMGTVICGFTYWAYHALSPVNTTEQSTASSVAELPTLPAFPTLEGDADLSQRLVQIYQTASPGVVAILTYGEEGGQGSGFVYNDQGYIVTNYHVVAKAEKIEVDFVSGLKVWAQMIGKDLDSDLAVIKVDVPPEHLHPLPLGDSDALQVGEMVVAIGNPFGLRSTMTCGIVSAKGRTLESERASRVGGYFSTGDIIQTDAPINPGNSGGPLLNLRGQVVGVNRAIRTSGMTVFGEPVNSGIGFAVPSNIVQRVVPVLIQGQAYTYPYIGISSVDQLSLEDIERLGLPQTTGVYIVSVAPGSPADKAGLRGATREGQNPHELPPGGDLIIAADGHPIRDFGDLMYYLMYNKQPGDRVTFTVIRDGQRRDITVVLGRRQ